MPPPAPGCAGCAARDAETAGLRAQLAELTGLQEELRARAAEAAELRDRVARLERIISRNSGNSSMPPSGDDAPGRKPPRKQRRAQEREDAKKRERGKQPGAPGAAMCWAEPDDTRDHYPAGACACGADLAGAAGLGVARSFRQLEVPEPSAQRIQHDLHETVCGCGRHHVAARPPGVPDSPVSIGPNLRALAVYLLVFQHVPVERCRGLISDAAGAQVSAGFIHSCLRKAAELAADVVRLIASLITAARVAGFGETTLRAGPAGQKKYVLGAFTEDYSLLHLGDRDLGSLPRLRHPPGLRRRRRLRPVRQLLARWLGKRRRAPGLPGSHTAGLPGRRRDLPGRALARPGAAGTARPDPRLERRPRQRPGRDPRRHGRAADHRVPARRHRRPARRAPHPRPEELHRPAPRP